MSAMANHDLSGALGRVDRIRPAYAQVAEQLRALVLRGDLTPGDRLPNESQMAEQFGVSRTTVREAIRVLSSQGLLKTERGVNGGTFVSAADPEQVIDLLEIGLNVLAGNEGLSVYELLEIREMLEIPGARLAAERRTDDDLATLERLHEIEERAIDADFEQRYAAHTEFHLAIVRAAQNRMLFVLLDPLFKVLESFAREVHGFAPLQTGVATDHESVLDAIRAQDPETAASIMREHLDHLRLAYTITSGERLDDPIPTEEPAT